MCTYIMELIHNFLLSVNTTAFSEVFLLLQVALGAVSYTHLTLPTKA